MIQERTTDVPLGLESPQENLVWWDGTHMPGLPDYVLPGVNDFESFFLTETDALEFRERFSAYIQAELTSCPICMTWASAVQMAQKDGLVAYLLDGMGNEVCR